MSAKHVETVVESGTEIFVPLNKLKKSPKNARKTPHGEATIEALAASITAKGMLQNLVVEPEHDGDGEVTGSYFVTVGEGRRLAQLLRVKRKEIKKTEPIRCIIDTANDPHEISLDENVTRENMHPADQFEAFKKLAEERGYGAEEIAARFGVTPHVVRQRLRLGAVSPKLMQAYRDGGLALDQLMAFAITEDHTRSVSSKPNCARRRRRCGSRQTSGGRTFARSPPTNIALNEVSIARQTARELQKNIGSVQGIDYNLVQQTRVNGLASVEGEALLTRFAVVETGNLDFQARDMVAQVARILVGSKPLDVYVTHLYMSRGDDSLRLFQVQQLLAWIDERNDVSDCIVCGDFNATLDMPSAALMARRFRPSQTSPTAFTPLAGRDGAISHPYWPRMDRCIDYIWTTGAIETLASGVCFDKPDSTDPSLWPSDHAGVWADFEF